MGRHAAWSSLILLVVLGVGCGEEPSPERARSLPRTSAIETMERTSSLLDMTAKPPPPPSLSNVEALAEGDNLLSADPRPWRSPASVDGGELRRGTLWLPDSYTWLTNNTTAVHDINAYVVEAVAVRHQDEPGRWAPQLAERVTVSDDGRVYTVYLKRGVMWQMPVLGEGTIPPERQDVMLSAYDFEFAFQMLKDTRVTRAAAVRSWYSTCRELRVINDHTFQMIWSEPGFAAQVGTLTMTPLARHIYAYDRDGNERFEDAADLMDEHWYMFPYGTGPYRVDPEGLIGSSGVVATRGLRLVRNERYHGVPPAIESVRYTNFLRQGERQMVQELLKDNLDFIELTPAAYRAMVLEAPLKSPMRRGEVTVVKTPDLGFQYIGWNLFASPTNDGRVRRALTMAMNRQRVIDEAYQGLGRVATGPFPQDSPDSDPKIEPLPFDLDAASALLDEAGWRERGSDGVRVRQVYDRHGLTRYERLVITIGGYVRADESAVRMLSLYQKDLARIGVELRVAEPPSGQEMAMARLFVDELRADDGGHYHGVLGGWGMDWENDLYQVWHSSQMVWGRNNPRGVTGGSNTVGYSNPVVDDLIERVRQRASLEERQPLQYEIHRLIHEDQPYTFVIERQMLMVHGPRLRGVRFQKIRPHDNHLTWWLAEAD